MFCRIVRFCFGHIRFDGEYTTQYCVELAVLFGHIRFDGGYTTQYCVEFAVACRSHTTSMLPHTILTLLVLLVSSLRHNFMDVRKVCFEKEKVYELRLVHTLLCYYLSLCRKTETISTLYTISISRSFPVTL